MEAIVGALTAGGLILSCLFWMALIEHGCDIKTHESLTRSLKTQIEAQQAAIESLAARLDQCVKRSEYDKDFNEGVKDFNEHADRIDALESRLDRFTSALRDAI